MGLLRTIGAVANAFATHIYNKTKGLLIIAATVPLAFLFVSVFVAAPLAVLFLCGIISAGYGIKSAVSKVRAEKMAKKNPRIVRIDQPPPPRPQQSTFNQAHQRNPRSSFQNAAQYGSQQPYGGQQQWSAEEQARRDFNQKYQTYNANNPNGFDEDDEDDRYERQARENERRRSEAEAAERRGQREQ